MKNSGKCGSAALNIVQNSICSFSGQNDTPNAPGPEGGRVQSYGQLVKQGLKDAFPGPGTACRGGSNVPE